VNQGIGALSLDHEASHSGPQSVVHNLLSGRVAQQDHPDRWHGADDLPGCFHAIQHRQHHVEHHDVRPVLPCEADCVSPVGGATHHLEPPGLEQRVKPFEEYQMVVREEDAGRAARPMARRFR
jgi:hypothetical protein